MDKYRRVQKARVPQDSAPAGPSEVRITQQGKVRAYISYASGLLAETERSVELKAMGHAISKAVTVAEVLKHRVAGLHQLTQLSSVETVDVFEPLEEGLDRVESKRNIPGISIRLSLDALDESDPGYQAPLPASQVTPPIRGSVSELKPSRRLRSARGKRGGGQEEDEANTDEEAAVADVEPSDEHVEDGVVAEVGRVRGGKRGRGGRGRGRARGGRGDGDSAVDGDSVVESTNLTVSGMPSTDVELGDGVDAVEVPLASAASGKKSSRGRRSGRKKKAPVVDGVASKEHDDSGGGDNDGEEPASRGRGGRGGRGRGRGRGARRELKASSEVTDGPAAPAAD